MTKSKLGKKWFISITQFIMEGSQGKNSRQELNQRLKRNAANLFSDSHSTVFLTPLGPHAHGGTCHTELGPHMLIMSTV